MASPLFLFPDRLRSSFVIGESRRRRWEVDPVAWVRERVKRHVWSKQAEILRSIRDHRNTAVVACHGPGKSFIAAQAVAWWIDIHKIGDAVAVTTAPTDRQVKTVLWKEIRRARKRGDLPGRTNQKEWLITPPNGEEEIVAFGMKPSDYEPGAFQGIHAPFMLVILDEACAIPGVSPEHPFSLWEASDSLLSNDNCRRLAIGNPDDSLSEFARVCQPGSGWNVIKIGAFDTPNFTRELVPDPVRNALVGFSWVEEKRKKLAPRWEWNEAKTACVPPDGERIEDAHPLWVSKVLGQFPINGDAQGLLPIPWVEAAMARTLRKDGPNELGVDVGAGGDSSTIAHRIGSVVRVVSEDRNPDTMQTCGKVIEYRKKLGASTAKIDVIGIGKGLVDRGLELHEPFIGINVGEAAQDSEAFVNRRAELFWGLRERFEQGSVDLDYRDEDLLAELVSIRYKRTSRGQIQIESKDEIKRRLGRSPNRAEAVMLAFATEKEDTTPMFERLW